MTLRRDWKLRIWWQTWTVCSFPPMCWTFLHNHCLAVFLYTTRGGSLKGRSHWWVCSRGTPVSHTGSWNLISVCLSYYQSKLFISPGWLFFFRILQFKKGFPRWSCFWILNVSVRNHLTCRTLIQNFNIFSCVYSIKFYNISFYKFGIDQK